MKFFNTLLFVVLCNALYANTFAEDVVRSKDSSCTSCNNAFAQCCADLPQPPKDTPVPLEGQNCICCFESRDLPSGSRNLNENKACQGYDAMCKSFCKRLKYPGIEFPEELTYTLSPTFTVPDCQKIVNPPVVPDDIKLSLRGKHVLVIGGSKGIGKAIAKMFSSPEVGAKVIATSRHPECYKKPHRYKLLQLDVRFDDEVAVFIKHVAKHYFHRKIDIVVNCAGIKWTGPMAEATGDDLVNIFNNNVAGYQRVVHNALPYMRHSNETRMISFGSMQSYVYYGYIGDGYAITKRALQQWNDTLQVEEMLKKAQGIEKFGPMFTLMEPYFINTSIGLYEFYKPSELSVDDPLVLGARFQAAVPQNIDGNDVSFAAEYTRRVAEAPQPGVRYAVVDPASMIELPGVGLVPVLTAIQAANAIPQDDLVQLFAAIGAQLIDGVQASKDLVTEAFCKSCKHHCHKSE
ncbi:MAG: SDR family NAD(P)-dependent oxidoreductase [Candidatus Babeliales bacterium]